MCKKCRCTISPTISQFNPALQPFGGRKCRNCGKDLTGQDYFYVSRGKPYCKRCIEDASADDLVRFCETMWNEWIEKMGIAAVSTDLWKGGSAWD